MVIDKNSALKAFYYLMLADGVTSFEEERFDEIGSELLGESFTDNKAEIISECQQQIESIEVDEERYEVIQNSIGDLLSNTVKIVKDGVVPRLLVWNMLSLANSDDDYSANENKLVSYVADVVGVEKSIFLEMKQLMGTLVANQKEKDLLEISERPYNEIKPIMEEVEKRNRGLMEAVMILIADDIILDEIEDEKKNNIIVDTGKKIGSTVASGGKKLGEKVSPVAKNLGGKALVGAVSAAEGVGKIFGKMKNVAKKNKDGGDQ